MIKSRTKRPPKISNCGCYEKVTKDNKRIKNKIRKQKKRKYKIKCQKENKYGGYIVKAIFSIFRQNIVLF